MRVKNFFPVILFILTVLFSGCAHLSPKPSIDYSHRPEACSRFFEALTDTVNETGVPDAGTVPIPGFPYLRTNRFLSALAEKVTDENRFADWLVFYGEDKRLAFMGPIMWSKACRDQMLRFIQAQVQQRDIETKQINSALPALSKNTRVY